MYGTPEDWERGYQRRNRRGHWRGSYRVWARGYDGRFREVPRSGKRWGRDRFHPRNTYRTLGSALNAARHAASWAPGGVAYVRCEVGPPAFTVRHDEDGWQPGQLFRVYAPERVQ